jgi:hypothetical protein
MNNRTFNSLMHFYNERWAAEALGMRVNEKKGPDLIDEDKVVEVKFKLLYPNKYVHICWRTLEHQMAYGDRGKAYWALGTYLFSRQVSEIRRRDMRDIEFFVLNRELTIVPWDWIFQFKPYRQTGKTEKSQWDNTIRFPKARFLPEIIASYSVKKGKVHLALGVTVEDFIIPGERVQ